MFEALCAYCIKGTKFLIKSRLTDLSCEEIDRPTVTFLLLLHLEMDSQLQSSSPSPRKKKKEGSQWKHMTSKHFVSAHK
jgi:hypothetical protein